jgi:SMI1 / KNR4 family (SUKH-1)
MKDLLKALSKEAIANNPDFFTEEEKQAQWIGRPAATDEAIAATEKKLGITLPADVLALYKITNGTAVVLNQTFGAFEPIEKVDWLKNADPGLIEAYSGITEDLTNDLSNSIIIAGIMYPHCVLLIQPYGRHEVWRYWEFANYLPGEIPFQGIEKYLERLHDFVSEQNINKAETEK